MKDLYNFSLLVVHFDFLIELEEYRRFEIQIS
jgi:hypothetical protein